MTDNNTLKFRMPLKDKHISIASFQNYTQKDGKKHIFTFDGCNYHWYTLLLDSGNNELILCIEPDFPFEDTFKIYRDFYHSWIEEVKKVAHDYNIIDAIDWHNIAYIYAQFK